MPIGCVRSVLCTPREISGSAPDDQTSSPSEDECSNLPLGIVDCRRNLAGSARTGVDEWTGE